MISDALPGFGDRRVAGLATPDEDAAIDVFNDRLKTGGHWVFAGGLGAPSTATVIDNRGGQALVTEGSKACNRKVEVRPLHGA